jgi:pimeloyl-ACP methyl ester carboxylesterase
VLSSCAGSPALGEDRATATGAGSATDFAGLVDIGGDREIYLECRGSGSPTVILISGTQGAGDDWTHVLGPDGPQPSTSSVFDQVAEFTRVCIYDRPGTTHFGPEPNASTPVTQPTTAEEGVDDLAALLTAAEEPGPYVLVGASWGGLIAQLYARQYPDDVAGLVFVDAASEFLQETLTTTQWANWMQMTQAALANPGVEVPDYEPSIAAVLEAGAVPDVPVVVLTSDQPWDLQVGDGSTWPAWLAAQAQLAAALDATHVSETGSGHAINVEQPQVVVDAIREVVDSVRQPS